MVARPFGENEQVAFEVSEVIGPRVAAWCDLHLGSQMANELFRTGHLACVIGMAAALYPALATVTETRDFLAAYAAARRRSFSPAELQRCWAAGVWTRACGAKEQHATGQPVISLAQDEAHARLRRAGMR